MVTDVGPDAWLPSDVATIGESGPDFPRLRHRGPHRGVGAPTLPGQWHGVPLSGFRAPGQDSETPASWLCLASDCFPWLGPGLRLHLIWGGKEDPAKRIFSWFQRMSVILGDICHLSIPHFCTAQSSPNLENWGGESPILFFFPHIPSKQNIYIHIKNLLKNLSQYVADINTWIPTWIRFLVTVKGLHVDTLS